MVQGSHRIISQMCTTNAVWCRCPSVFSDSHPFVEGAGIQPTSAIRPEGRHGQPSTPHQFSHLPRKCACSGGKCQWPNLEPEEIKLFEIILILQLYLPFWTNSSGRLGRPKPGYCHEQRLHRQQCPDTFLSVLGSLAPVIKWGKMRRGTVTPSQERGS